MSAEAVPAPVAARRRAVGAAASRPSRPWVVALAVVGLVVLWHVVSLLAGENKSGDSLVPTIVDIADAVPRFADYWKGGLGVEATKVGGAVTWQGVLLGLGYNVGITGLRLAAGLVLGILVGLALATSVCWSPLLRAMFTLPGHFARMLPLLAMVPLFGLWFGDSEQGSVLFIAFTAFSLVFAIALNAIANVPGYYAQFARSLGASGGRTYVTVVLPAALPEIRAGVMLAVGFGWSAAIASEYLGQEYGLGHIVQNAEFFGRTNLLALVALLSLALAAVSFLLARRALDWVTRWAE
jgi:sulfonate transport system permease protein